MVLKNFTKSKFVHVACLTRTSSGAGSWPGCEWCWPQGATPSTAWRPRPPPPLLLLPAPSPPPTSPLWPTDTPLIPPMAAPLRSSSEDMPTTSPHRYLPSLCKLYHISCLLSFCNDRTHMHSFALLFFWIFSIDHMLYLSSDPNSTLVCTTISFPPEIFKLTSWEVYMVDFVSLLFLSVLFNIGFDLYGQHTILLHQGKVIDFSFCLSLLIPSDSLFYLS